MSESSTNFLELVKRWVEFRHCEQTATLVLSLADHAPPITNPELADDGSALENGSDEVPYLGQVMPQGCIMC
jgi:hypothetical protein